MSEAPIDEARDEIAEYLSERDSELGFLLVGQKKDMAISVRNISGRRRWTKLHEWLEDGTCRQNRGT